MHIPYTGTASVRCNCIRSILIQYIVQVYLSLSCMYNYKLIRFLGIEYTLSHNDLVILTVFRFGLGTFSSS